MGATDDYGARSGSTKTAWLDCTASPAGEGPVEGAGRRPRRRCVTRPSPSARPRRRAAAAASRVGSAAPLARHGARDRWTRERLRGSARRDGLAGGGGWGAGSKPGDDVVNWSNQVDAGKVPARTLPAPRGVGRPASANTRTSLGRTTWRPSLRASHHRNASTQPMSGHGHLACWLGQACARTEAVIERRRGGSPGTSAGSSGVAPVRASTSEMEQSAYRSSGRSRPRQ